MKQFSDLLGKTLNNLEISYDEVRFTIRGEEKKYRLFHSQDCCESVTVEEVHGDISDMVFTPVLLAEEVSEDVSEKYGDSATWTFYKLATVRGHLTIRFLGESNGYYSEEVDFGECP